MAIRPHMKTLVPLLLILLPTAAFADASSVAAALQGKDAECRYFRQLCAKVEAAKAAMLAHIDEARAFNARSSAGFDRDEARRLDLEAAATRGALIRAVNDAIEARNVLRAKHEKPLDCLECAVLDE